MSKFWKNVGNAALIIVISSSVAAGVTAHLLKGKNGRGMFSDVIETSFKQPLHLTSYNNVAAESTDFTYAAEKTVNAVVYIQVTSTVSGGRRSMDPLEYFFGYGDRQQRPRQRMGSGSGVIISTDGYIITNNHVVEGSDSISVTLNDKRVFIGKKIGGDATTDIALIKIEADDLQPVPFGDSDNLKVGEWVLAVGNPFNLTSTVTAGIVSAKERSAIGRSDDISKVSSYIQTDAAVNMGNSGGALVNTRGELVGINAAILSQTGDFAGYSFAVPINMAIRVVNDLKKYGVLQRPMLGITMSEPGYIKNSDDPEISDSKIKVLEGAYVTNFAQRSPAKEAGIVIGDVIIAVDGNKITSPSAVQELILKYHVGDKVKIKVDRYGSEKEFTVELRNAQGNTEIVKAELKSEEILGASFRTISNRIKRDFGINNGIEVTNIKEGKIKEHGIEEGFIIMLVNDQKIETADDLHKIVNKIIKENSEEKGLFIKGFYPSTRSTRHYAIDLID